MHAKSEGVFGTNITNPENRTKQKLGSTHMPSTTKHRIWPSPTKHKMETPWTDYTATEGVMPRCQEDMHVVPPQVVIAQIYPTVHSNKNIMSQQMRHNNYKRGSNTYMLNRNKSTQSPKIF